MRLERVHSPLDVTAFRVRQLGWAVAALAAAGAATAAVHPAPLQRYDGRTRPAQPDAVLVALSAADAGIADIERRRDLLDDEAVRAVLVVAGHRLRSTRRTWVAGLSDREVEVLRLVARGSSNSQMAAMLSLSQSTIHHHIQHIYNKLGVSTRAAAALFAMQHNLLS